MDLSVASSFSMASTALLPSCVPTTLPARPALFVMGEPAFTMMIWWLVM